MPQMAPINWLSLFFIFCLTFLMFNLLNYFSWNINSGSMNKDQSTSNINNKSKNFNWKW